MSMAGHGTEGAASRAGGRWYLVLMAVALLWFFPYQGHLNNPNENVRLYLTRALVEHGTVAIGHRWGAAGKLEDSGSVVGEWGRVNDKALVCDDPEQSPPDCAGRLLAAKAPGLSLLAVPPYALISFCWKAVGGRPLGKMWSIRLLRLLMVTLPWALFLVLFPRWLLSLGPVDRPSADLATLSLGLGSIATPAAELFAGHAPVALSLGSALILLHRGRGRPGRTAAAGCLLALSIALEYPMAMPALLVGLHGLWAAPRGRRPMALMWMILGGLPVMALLLGYHSVAMGHPLATPYAFLENPAFVRDSAPGLHGLALPGLRSLAQGLFSPQVGLLFFWPAAALAPAGALLLLLRSEERDLRLLGASLLALMAAFVLMIASMPNLRRMLGWTVGPRYIVGIAPFAATGLAVLLARARARWPLLAAPAAAGLVLAGLVLCGLPALLYPHYPMALRNPSFQLGLPLLARGYLPHSLGHLLGLEGWWAAAPGLAAFVASGLCVLLPEEPTLSWAWLRSRAAARAALKVALTLLVALALLGLLSLPGIRARPRELRELAWVRRRWEPRPPEPSDPGQAARGAAEEARPEDALRIILQGEGYRQSHRRERRGRGD